MDLQQVAVRGVDRALFAELSLTITDGDRVGVIGINGTGKSTLLRVVAGAEAPDAGAVRFGRGVRVGFLPQQPTLPAGTVGAAVGDGWQIAAALERVGMGRAAGRDTATLSGGEAKRVALAQLLAQPAELLVLDEPTNHLDLQAVAWLEQQLRARPGGLVLVSHDRHLLDAVTTRMLELDRGRAIVHHGGYASFLEAQIARHEQAAAAEAARRNLARRELAWLHRGAPARSRKPQARVSAARAVVEGRPDGGARLSDLDLAFSTPRLGDKVVELRGVSFSYRPGGPAVVDGIDLSVARRERLAVVGANGTGKTTLLRLLAGQLPPTAGTVERGPTVALALVEQQGAAVDLSATVRQLVAGPGRPPGLPEDVALMERFWFTGSLQHAEVRTLSGGERRRLELLLVLARRPNVLLLDEPTNDLDIDTLRVLEDYLEQWPGALVTVSHDRTFLERVTDRVAALTADGTLSAVPGGLAGWVAGQQAPAGWVAGQQSPAGWVAGQQEPANRPPPSRTSPPPATGRGDRSGRRAQPAPQRQLRQLDKQMERLRRRCEELHQQLRGVSGHEELARVGSQLADADAELRRVEEEWLAVAEEAERVRR